MSLNCKEQVSVSIINYELATIFGVLAAAKVILCILILLVLVPILVYQGYIQQRARTAKSRRTKKLLKHLIQVPFTPERF